MIHREATIRYKGYDPSNLKSQSNKRICVICDVCGRVRYIEKYAYRDLCVSCAQNKKWEYPEYREMIRNIYANPEYKRRLKKGYIKRSSNSEWLRNVGGGGRDLDGNRNEEFAKRMSAIKQGISYDEWTGFSERYNNFKNCIFLNEPFHGCHRHHITKTIVICIPSELHIHITHSLKTGYNMDKINLIALQYINGGL